MKKMFEPLLLAWEGVRTHKLRSSLTILGIVIGVAAVIGLMSIGRGVQTQILSRIESMGSDVITVSPGFVTERGIAGAGGSAATLTLEDAEAILEQVPYVVAVAPYSATSQQLIVGGENVNAQVIGVTPEYQDANNLDIAAGVFISQYNYESGTKVAVLGSNVADTLFNGVDPIGQQLRMGSNIVRVMGVLESKGRSFGMSSTDDTILIPLTTMQQTISQPRTASGGHVVSSIALMISDEGQMSSVVTETESLLRSRHELATGDEDDFSVQTLEELVSTVTEVSGTMTLFLGAIAAISLLVGGIGVMNIMLVSVVERTREIGIRKALGARERDIWGQFLTESALLSFAGGLIGVAVGWGASKFISGVEIMGEITTVVSADIVILALVVSVGIGLLFGFLPARRASRLNPIEALRYE